MLHSEIAKDLPVIDIDVFYLIKQIKQAESGLKTEYFWPQAWRRVHVRARYIFPKTKRLTKRLKKRKVGVTLVTESNNSDEI